MSLDTVTLDDALRLLSLPRVVGVDPSDGAEVTVQTGRYGPYVRKGAESRSLDTDDHIFTITLEEALQVLAQPKRGRASAPKGPLRELGDDPASGEPVTVREGRFGPYVTDGTTNASLRVGDAVDTVTLERAAELLQDRRDRGPAKPKKAAAKKARAKPKKAAAKAAGGSKRSAG
jgi:DNA topoisomerase-1